MDNSAQNRRQAFSCWLRTGRWPQPPASAGVEFKFNPYHDPRNGQFTYAPGGPRSLTNAALTKHRTTGRHAGVAAATSSPRPSSEASRTLQPSDAVYVRGEAAASFQPVTMPADPSQRGGNIRAFEDPMTLEQTFPGLQNAPGGSILALADNLLDITGPAREAQNELLQRETDKLIEQIKALNPKFVYATPWPEQTFEGKINNINRLRFERAVTFMHIRAELRPLQVETLRFLQERVDAAYARGIKLLRAGDLTIRLSESEALGNYVDRQVRMELRERYNIFNIDSSGRGPVRVNRREDEIGGTDSTYRRPDARVDDIAYDVTLTGKTAKTAQV